MFVKVRLCFKTKFITHQKLERLDQNTADAVEASLRQVADASEIVKVEVVQNDMNQASNQPGISGTVATRFETL